MTDIRYVCGCSAGRVTKGDSPFAIAQTVATKRVGPWWNRYDEATEVILAHIHFIKDEEPKRLRKEAE